MQATVTNSPAQPEVAKWVRVADDNDRPCHEALLDLVEVPNEQCRLGLRSPAALPAKEHHARPSCAQEVRESSKVGVGGDEDAALLGRGSEHNWVRRAREAELMNVDRIEPGIVQEIGNAR